ncbi:MAG TPA: MBL fold metallo-hydrolase [Candidatus Fimivicinus intestinavium]|nr:MBL fold metallo-hydrolase [Candidatus Fimivicinus intestinavium]
MTTKKKILTSVCVTAGVLAAALAVFLGGDALLRRNTQKIPVSEEDFQQESGADRIHFLNTGASDAILIESDGHFALVDAGEDSDYPADRPNLRYTGYEQVVLQYLKDHAADENGKVTLDFVLATHAHSDHMGGFDTVIADPDITVKRAYLKRYHPDNILSKEKRRWDNQEVYDQMVQALEARGVKIISDIPTEPFLLGNFTVRFLNTELDTVNQGIDENDNSVLTLLEKDGTRALLTGDLNNLSGDETRLAPEIGKIDLLKIGHHGYVFSSSWKFLQTLKPSVTVATNSRAKMIYPTVKWRLAATGSALFQTVDRNGVIASFLDGGGLVMTENSMSAAQMELTIPVQDPQE